MAVSNNNIEFSSPVKESFSWVTPDNDFNKLCFPSKRKCNSDSGYVSSSISPGSGCRTSSSNRLLMTPDISSCSRFGMRAQGEIYTPAITVKPDYLKKRLLQSSEDAHSSSFINAIPVDEVDSYTEFMDTSLYTEPMEISIIEANQHCSTSPVDLNAEENLDMREISKKITVDLSADEVNSICSEPITPFRSKIPADRLYSSSSSFKSSLTSPRKKRQFLKKKTRVKSLVGCEKVDFLSQLGEKANYSLAVCKILDYLSDSDLGNITMVSKTWKNVCLSYPKAKERWRKYIADRKERKENLHCSGGKQKRVMTPLLNRNHSTPLQMRQPASPPVSPSKYRFHLFQKEARKLKEDEKLLECPRCSLPSTVSPLIRYGRCSRAGCGLEFCSSCRSPYHGTTPCTTSTPTSPQRPKRIGSKESKRFLRRL